MAARGSIYVGNQLVAQTTEELFKPDEFEAIDHAAHDVRRDPIMKIERRQVANLVDEVKRLRRAAIMPPVVNAARQ